MIQPEADQPTRLLWHAGQVVYRIKRERQCQHLGYRNAHKIRPNGSHLFITVNQRDLMPRIAQSITCCASEWFNNRVITRIWIVRRGSPFAAKVSKKWSKGLCHVQYSTGWAVGGWTGHLGLRRHARHI